MSLVTRKGKETWSILFISRNIYKWRSQLDYPYALCDIYIRSCAPLAIWVMNHDHHVFKVFMSYTLISLVMLWVGEPLRSFTIITLCECTISILGRLMAPWIWESFWGSTFSSSSLVLDLTRFCPIIFYLKITL